MTYKFLLRGIYLFLTCIIIQHYQGLCRCIVKLWKEPKNKQFSVFMHAPPEHVWMHMKAFFGTEYNVICCKQEVFYYLALPAGIVSLHCENLIKTFLAQNTVRFVVNKKFSIIQHYQELCRCIVKIWKANNLVCSCTPP